MNQKTAQATRAPSSFAQSSRATCASSCAMIASASPVAATAFGLSTIVGRSTPQLIGERSSSLTSSAVPCLNPIRRCASASADSHDGCTSTSARPRIANSRTTASSITPTSSSSGIA
nr:hypothetical protein [Sphingopyxis sp. PET50]